MLVNSIECGIVIDHITAGLGAKILEFLDIDLNTNTIAFIMNASSKKHGKKDIVKIERVTDIDLTVLGLIEPNATVNIIKDGKIVEKIALEVPKTVTNVIKCKNPRCVTSVEANAPHVFHLIDEENREYRCEYCDEIVSMKGEY
ncbi:aspartate carbamoyltransferase regulatory subunit [Clostridium aminobutyricum]|uniref:Aspartate carbamoyltransferase regulatory subunit n=1 Tax=Clostridium aminobutyricum TaxID=33953 RepID=A0A939D6H7_CLOAM|nr:aspartate carbamoyltransferase regulatory subunit [Clostridium aminobutyricum]MBN7771966.1 aspartate carbamoyltransferase regulatory subunit [Clostridium aminobutyricum]